MNKKQILISGAVIAIVAALVYTQLRTWRRFDWGTFQAESSAVNWLMVLMAVALIYATYFLRAVRWTIFLRPVCRARTRDLIAPTLIGFAGLALLGRPGEFIRPYVIARKENLSVSSQIGVWTVERIFDLGAFTVLAAVDIFTAKYLPGKEYFRPAGFVLIAIVLGLSVGAFFMRRYGNQVAAWLARRLRFAPKFSMHVAGKARAFGEGLNTIHDLSSFLQLAFVSLAIWFCISLAYLQVAHAYPELADSLPYSQALLLVGFSMAGGIVQLPAIGGGSQLATIAGLVHVFDVRKELAVSCGILLWLVTFVSVTPAGLVLARREHVSIRRLSEESHEEEEKEEEEQAAIEDVPSHPDA